MKSQHTGDKVTGTAKATKVCCQHSQLEEMLTFCDLEQNFMAFLMCGPETNKKKS